MSQSAIISSHDNPINCMTELVKDAARQFPCGKFNVAIKKFGLERHFRNYFPKACSKQVMKDAGGKSELKKIFYAETVMFK
ncbi:hypothetical protein [Vibrio harveyi]|uniref:hypothetical protein n=1 Tax=Vibrio harveyi TaxID=669 RepID=UPI002480FB45|nr:hypothetical protein [Vibrio harveyi]